MHTFEVPCQTSRGRADHAARGAQFINLVSGSHLQVGEGLRSCTPDVQTSQPFDLCGRRVTLIDTPGFDDTDAEEKETLRKIAVALTIM